MTKAVVSVSSIYHEATFHMIKYNNNGNDEKPFIALLSFFSTCHFIKCSQKSIHLN